jgi:hypothetical protein
VLAAGGRFHTRFKSGDQDSEVPVHADMGAARVTLLRLPLLVAKTSGMLTRQWRLRELEGEPVLVCWTCQSGRDLRGGRARGIDSGE